jgi:RHS repeat-associated protein
MEGDAAWKPVAGKFASPAAGDVTADSINTYLYDGDGRACAVKSTPLAGYTTMTEYIYDAEGRRVAKGTITTLSCDPSTNGFHLTASYVLDEDGSELTQQDGSGNWQRTNVYVAGKLLATYDPNGLHFHLSDPLGTRRMQVSGNLNTIGVPDTDIQSLPFGDALYSYPDPYATADDATPLHFTGKERDAESGNDYFGARYYASSMGRFLSPDWSAKVEPVPYAKLDNPQSLNLYAYVDNNPLSSFDPDGHLKCVYCAQRLLGMHLKKDVAQQQTYQHQPTKDANVPVVISDVKANTPLGHSTVQVGADQRVGLVPNSDKKAAEAVAKQAAELVKDGAPLPESAPGHIEGNSAATTSSTTIYVTNAQASAMRTYISGAENSPQSYDAAYHNCVSGFSVEVLRAGGVNAPMDITPAGLVGDLSH